MKGVGGSLLDILRHEGQAVLVHQSLLRHVYGLVLSAVRFHREVCWLAWQQLAAVAEVAATLPSPYSCRCISERA